MYAFIRETNVLFLTSGIEFLGIIYSLFRGRQNIFLEHLVLNLSYNILKSIDKNKSYVQKYF